MEFCDERKVACALGGRYSSRDTWKGVEGTLARTPEPVLSASFPAALEEFRVGRPILLHDNSEPHAPTFLAIAEDSASVEEMRAIAQAASGLLCLLTPCKDLDSVQLRSPLIQEFSLGACIGKGAQNPADGSMFRRGKTVIIPVTAQLRRVWRSSSAMHCALAFACLAGKAPAVFFCRIPFNMQSGVGKGLENIEGLGRLVAIGTEEIQVHCRRCHARRCGAGVQTPD